MDRCTYCGKEISYFFVCPHCKEKFCKLHKSHEIHECKGVVQPSQQNYAENTLVNDARVIVIEPPINNIEERETGEETVFEGGPLKFLKAKIADS